MGGRRPLRYSLIFAFALFTGNRDYTGMWVRRGSTNLMAGKVVFLRGLLSPIRVVDLMAIPNAAINFDAQFPQQIEAPDAKLKLGI
ncbi:hypothetical protein TNCV_2361 [Trichonephila clavipes]|nr:hypothetical protein TNCV_2361 [Trichonephila clavipes]